MELNKIYNENCLDTMSRMPDGFVDLTVTSPPYDNLRNYNGYTFDFEPIAKELFRVTKQGGVAVWVVGDATINGSETGTSFRQALGFKEIGFSLHDTMIYEKANGSFGSTLCYIQTFEFMFVFGKGRPNAINLLRDRKNRPQGDRTTICKGRDSNGDLVKARKNYEYAEYGRRKNIWRYSVGLGGTTNDSIAFDHPAIFPESLAADHIKSWSNPSDIVYDPFMGSGTTAKAAHLLGRQWIGSEISAEYCEIANKRLEPYLAQVSLFG